MRVTILNLHQATHVFLNQIQSYGQSPEKTKNNGEHEKRGNINT